MQACYAAYNDWLYEDFCSVAPDRLIGVAMLPPHPEAAYAELKRLAEKGGCRQANLQIAVAEPRLEDPRWEPLFDLLEQSGIVLSFHVTVFPKAGDAFDKYKGSPGATFLHAKMFIEQFLDPFVDLFAWGILERHPKLKIVIAESGVGWVPWVVEELDYRHWRLWECKEFWDDKGGIPHKMKPSEVFQRQVYGTFQQSPTAMRLLEFWGPENLLWASDYPHPDSIWPNSVRTIGETMGHMDPERGPRPRRRQCGQALRARPVARRPCGRSCRSATRRSPPNRPRFTDARGLVDFRASFACSMALPNSIG